MIIVIITSRFIYYNSLCIMFAENYFLFNKILVKMTFYVN